MTGKSASIDSISRRPFFGIELAPRQKAAAPETQRIRRDGSIPLEPEPAKLISKGAGKDASWWPRFKSAEPRAPIAIPRTDLTAVPLAPQTLEPPPAFTEDSVEF